MATNRRLVVKEQEDFYPTPTWATKAFIECYSQTHPLLFELDDVLEPCCGDGAISKVLDDLGFNVTSFDIVNRGYGKVLSIYDYEVKHELVITNPPFNDMDRMFPKLYGLADTMLVLFLRTSFLEGKKRFNQIFGPTRPTSIYVHTERVSLYKNGVKGDQGGGTTSYSWFVWDKDVIRARDFDDKSYDTIVEWIPPGYKHD
jgi:hypothetical protein